MQERSYIAIDLKSFYASVECVERKLDPLNTNLVVADLARTEKTICLAVTPSLKAYGISGRARLFEVVQKVKEINFLRRDRLFGRKFAGKSYYADELQKSPQLELDYIIAPPRMALYIDYSVRIYKIYLKYIAPEDIHVYSIDEVFMDVTNYLRMYKMTPKELAMTIILDVLKTTGITATVGIGTNMYLAKIAMDITAKHISADENGVRIADLDERAYRYKMWEHKPLTDFWRVGKGYARKLEQHGMFTMGDVAICSVNNEDILYKLFGVNAELLIDHAWGWEPCTIADVKVYKPKSSSLSSGQVLKCPYTYEKAALVVREMTEMLALDLVDKGLVTNQLVLTIGYDIENITDLNRRYQYTGSIVIDHYGRQMPKHAHGTGNLQRYSSSSKELIKTVTELYERIVDKELLVRRITIVASHVIDEKSAVALQSGNEINLFEELGTVEAENEEREREHNIQKAMLGIKKRFGKNAVLKGMNLEEGATAIERNSCIGGHHA